MTAAERAALIARVRRHLEARDCDMFAHDGWLAELLELVERGPRSLRLELPTFASPEQTAGARELEGRLVAGGRTCEGHGITVLVVVTPEVAATHGQVIGLDEVRARTKCIIDGAAAVIEQMFPGVGVQPFEVQRYKPPPDGGGAQQN